MDHPNILRLIGYTETPPYLIVTPFIQKGSLFHLMKNSPESLTPTIRSSIAFEIAKGLEYLHSHHLIHRDLKSLNILMENNFSPKICDFGLVRTPKDSPMTGMIGTIQWMAPEVLLSSPSYDSTIDIYSFGILLWELLTLKNPYGEMKPSQIANEVTEKGLRPTVPPSTPLQLSKLIQNCWATSEDRPSIKYIVHQLQLPEYHFAGTNENEFSRIKSGSPFHQRTSSFPCTLR